MPIDINNMTPIDQGICLFIMSLVVGGLVLLTQDVFRK